MPDTKFYVSTTSLTLLLVCNWFLTLSYHYFADEDGNAVSLTRVSKLTGKPVPFIRCDVCNEHDLKSIFEKVRFYSILNHFVII